MAALEQVLASTFFVRAIKQTAFLRFIVERSINNSDLKDRRATLSSFDIAIDCFNRTPADPNDAYVRNIASQSRKSLKNYYNSLPRPPEVLIELAEKGYEVKCSYCNTETAIEIAEQHPPETSPLHRLTSPRLLPTVAVIPMRCVAGDTEHAVLGHMLSDSLITSLAKSKYMRVISRRTSAQFSKSEHSTNQLGELLNADYLVEGQLYVHGNTLRVQIELSSCNTDEVIWAEQLRSTVEAVVSETDELVSRILFGVSSQLLNYELQRALSMPLSSLQCHSLLIGSINIMHRGTLSDIKRAKQMLELLVQRNPHHAAPHAYLSYWAILDMVRDADFGDTDTTKEFVLTHVKKSLNTDSQHPVALTVNGLMKSHFDSDFLGARDLFDQAIHYSPNEAGAMGRLAVAQLYTGTTALASKTITNALRTSPLDPELYFFHSVAATAAFGEEDYDRAIANAEKSKALFPNHPSNLRTLIGSFSAKDDMLSAEKHKQHLLQIEPNFSLDNYAARSPFPKNEIIERLTRYLEKSGLPVRSKTV